MAKAKANTGRSSGRRKTAKPAEKTVRKVARSPGKARTKAGAKAKTNRKKTAQADKVREPDAHASPASGMFGVPEPRWLSSAPHRATPAARIAATGSGRRTRHRESDLEPQRTAVPAGPFMGASSQDSRRERQPPVEQIRPADEDPFGGDEAALELEVVELLAMEDPSELSRFEGDVLDESLINAALLELEADSASPDAAAKDAEPEAQETPVPQAEVETPSADDEAPADVTEAPTDVTKAPPDLTEGPADVTEAPADVIEASTTVAEAADDEPSPELLLEEMDESLASDVDDILQGACESVEELLEGADEVVGTTQDEAPVPATETLEPETSPDDPADPIQFVEAPASVEGPGEAAAAGDVAPPMDQPEAVPTVETATEVEAAEPPPAPIEVPLEAPVEKPVEEPAAGRRAAPAKTEKKPRSQPALALVILRLLAGMNYPVRLLPPPLRLVVDWIALSLVFWVPIVWMIALLVVGK